MEALGFELTGGLNSVEVVDPIHRMLGAECGLRNLWIVGGGRDATKVKVAQARAIGGAEDGADVEGAADVIEQGIDEWSIRDWAGRLGIGFWVGGMDALHLPAAFRAMTAGRSGNRGRKAKKTTRIQTLMNSE